MYGKGLSDEFDRQSLSAMVDYWISPAAVKKEFEASRSKTASLLIKYICSIFQILGFYLHELKQLYSSVDTCSSEKQ